jgi:small conductance mechanosensitive channel
MGRRILLLIFLPFLVVALVAALVVGVLQAAEIDITRLVTTVFGTGETARAVANLIDLFSVPIRIAVTAALFLVAWLVARGSWRVAGWLVGLPFLRERDRPEEPAAGEATAPPQGLPGQRRRNTLRYLVASLISITAYLVAAILAFGQFISLTNLAIVATILANAFGFAARDFIGDLLNGLSNIFEDRFDLGERVQVVRVGDAVEGVVEKLTVRTVSIRTRTGELIIVPQGEIRILRNYSRGSFTGTSVSISVSAGDLSPAMSLLQKLGDEAPSVLPDLIEPWRVISEDGSVRGTADLTIYARAEYGRGAELRLKMLALIQERLAGAGIRPVG